MLSSQPVEGREANCVERPLKNINEIWLETVGWKQRRRKTQSVGRRNSRYTDRRQKFCHVLRKGLALEWRRTNLDERTKLGEKAWRKIKACQNFSSRAYRISSLTVLLSRRLFSNCLFQFRFYLGNGYSVLVNFNDTIYGERKMKANIYIFFTSMKLQCKISILNKIKAT